MTEPTTEAGRRLADDPDNLPHGLLVTRILAIEAEASAKHSQHDYNAGRADALRETAERVRAHPRQWEDGDTIVIELAAVLAILTETE